MFAASLLLRKGNCGAKGEIFFTGCSAGRGSAFFWARIFLGDWLGGEAP